MLVVFGHILSTKMSFGQCEKKNYYHIFKKFEIKSLINKLVRANDF